MICRLGSIPSARDRPYRKRYHRPRKMPGDIQRVEMTHRVRIGLRHQIGRYPGKDMPVVFGERPGNGGLRRKPQ